MSDPYIDKVIAERAQEDIEMQTCSDCASLEHPSRIEHILHCTTTRVSAEASAHEPSDVMPGEYAWMKKKGVEKGDVMRPDLKKVTR